MRITLLLFLCCTQLVLGQQYADKTYYLIDDLDLSAISKSDSTYIEEVLKAFHATDSDSLKMLKIDEIVLNVWDENIWPKYNNWMMVQSKMALENSQSLSKDEIKFYFSVLSSSLNNIGFLADSKGNSDEAIKYYEQSLKYDAVLADTLGMAQLYNNIAGVYGKKGQFEKSLEYNLKALKIREALLDSAGMAQSYNNIGALYNDATNNDSLAILYTQKSLAIRRALGDLNGVGVCLMSMGRYIGSRGDINEEKKAYLEALAIFTGSNNRFGQGYALNNIGVYHSAQNNFDSAKYYFNAAIDIRESIEDKNGLGQSLTDKSNLNLKIFNQQGKKDQQLLKRIQEDAEQGFSIGKEIGYPALVMNTAVVLSKVYEEQNRAKDAVEMFRLHIQMRDSLTDVESRTAIIEAQTRYTYEKQKAVDDITRDKEVTLQKEKNKKQKIISIIISIGSIILASLLFILFRRLKITRLQNKKIEEQNKKIDLQHQTLEITHQEITDSINYAKRIQTALLPTNKVIAESFPDSFVLYLPKDVVAGDFYWKETVGDLNFIAAADCTGHGVPGAMVSVVCNSCLNRAVREFQLKTPAEILDKTRDLVIEEFEKSDEDVNDGMDISMISISGKALEFAGANNALWIIRDQELIEINGDKQPIGKHVNHKPFTNHTVQLEQGDIIYLFTDGYADQFGGEAGKKMKTSRLRTILIESSSVEFDLQKTMLSDLFNDWKGDIEQLDDVCVIGIKV